MKNEEVMSWQEETAHKRFQLIAPLLEEGLSPGERADLRRKTAEDQGVSERSLFRYELYYRKRGFSGLKPSNRAERRQAGRPENFDQLIAEAIQLKKEVPSRSVERIIMILEMEGAVAPGVLKRSTLHRYIYNAGLGVKQMKRYTEQRNASAGRYCKPHRMMLVQGDIKDGLYLPIGKNKKKVETHLSALIDQHSRYVLYSHWYSNEKKEIVVDTLHHAILLHGKMDVCLFDNGAQYISSQLLRSADKLGVRIKHCQAYHAWTKGVVEKFNGLVGSFLDEARAAKVTTLEELNQKWDIWVEEYYHKKPHAGIAEYYQSLQVPVPDEGISPLEEWNRDKRGLTFLDTAVVNEAFLNHETRRVDKAGCISLKGSKYEIGMAYCGAKVEVSFDPFDLTNTITARYKEDAPIKAKLFVIGEHCSAAPVVPVSFKQKAEVSGSRFLDALEKQHEKNKLSAVTAISFSGFGKEADSNG